MFGLAVYQFRWLDQGVCLKVGRIAAAQTEARTFLWFDYALGARHSYMHTLLKNLLCFFAEIRHRAAMSSLSFTCTYGRIACVPGPFS